MPTDYDEDRRYFTRIPDNEVTYCLQCAGHTLTASIESGGEPGAIVEHGEPLLVTVYDGISGQRFVELTPEDRRSWRNTNLQFDMDPWVCEHEMQEHLTRGRAC